jgi:MarR family transcriptional regulator, organic hydroperoxide resistance regulator
VPFDGHLPIEPPILIMHEFSPAPLGDDQASPYRDLLLDNQLCLALQVSSSLVTRIYRALLEPLGLTYPQYLVLIALWERTERSTMGDLRRALHMDTGALTPLVKRMGESGLVKRSRDVADERRVWVELTDRGRALRKPVAEVRREVVRRLPLSDADLADLRGRLQSLNAALAGASH